ncbi:Rho-type gtpase-activating protein [Microbotryomycetes sp. JL201]|nr:Rho-type gtpase-activating protein [Microbotryomycetes sp. JL201]
MDPPQVPDAPKVGADGVESSTDGHSRAATRHQEHLQPTNGSEPVVCNACKQGLEETLDNTVVSFGKYLFHVDCRCAKCNTLVEHDTNLLLLSDGSPVCENCSYICSVCEKPIHNEAIVTGDESYHADCFRCRSCHSKIEELIFAKTTAGIWCMSCHNERVARTRKHAEAKRNRASRKEGSVRPSGSTSASATKSRSATADKDRPHRTDAASTNGYFDIPTLESSSSGTRPLPPSPYGSGPAASTSTMSLADLASSSVASASKPSSSSYARHPKIPSVSVRPSSSSNSLTDLGRSTPSPLPRRGDDTRTPMVHPAFSHDSRARNASPSFSRTADGHLRRPSGEAVLPPPRPPSAEPLRLDPSPPPSARLPPRPGTSDSTKTSQLDDATTVSFGGLGSRQGSLSAPGQSDKAANRRSGFYGAMSLQGSFDAGRLGEDHTGRESPAPAPPPHDPPPTQASIIATAAAAASPPTIAATDLHGSMSFYEPDTLLFLDHVGSLPGSPPIGTGTSNNASRRRSGMFGNGVRGDAEQVEHLSPDLGSSRAYSDDEDEAGESRQKRVARPTDVARRVRESIRLSKASGDASTDGGKTVGGGLDVELVEMLLGELEVTKKEMKDLQEKYNAFRRVSRSAFEGFSMAREEYDKELAARRDTEARMDQLRSKFVEQAQRLAAIDKEQKQAEALKRQSKDLRNSVMGMEKHLSLLRAEVELSTAQAAQLAALEPAPAARQVLASMEPSKRCLFSLPYTDKAMPIGHAHRQEIKSLVEQRDELTREIATLKQDRDTLVNDISSLTTRQTELTDKNAESSRELENLRASMSRMRLTAGSSSSALNTNLAQQRLAQHQHSASSSSIAMSARSVPLSTRNISSPQPSNVDLAEMHRVIKPEHVEHSVAKKFKWGKAKTTVDAPRQALVSSLSKSPVVNARSTLSDSTKAHSFQQVSILRPVRCDYCGDKIWGLNEVRCTSCGSYAHAKCAGYLTGPCSVNGQPALNQDDTMTIISQAPVMFGNDLVAQVKAEGRDVPLVVSKCIAAVEAYGMAYEGIYRKTGGMGQTKLITQFFERGQDFDLEDLDKFNDLAAITSCLKNFFRCMPVPLFTHDLHEDFVACAEMPEGDNRLTKIEQILHKLPDAHYETARALFLHLHRVHLASNDNKMTPANLGVVFGPTVLRSSVASREWSDMGAKAKLVEIMVEHAPRLFKQSRSTTQ